MATATKTARTGRRAGHGAVGAAESVPTQFLVFENNGGDYQWTLLDRDGHGLARSPGFASYEEAESAARVVLAGAGSARLERRAEADGSDELT